MKILITNAGRRTYIVDYLFKLKDAYDPKIEVFVSDTSENTASFWVDKRLNKILTPRVGLSDKKYLNSLLKLCKKNKIDILIPLMDYELHLLAKNKKVFKNNGTLIIVSKYKTVVNFLDKEKNYKICLKNNLNVPRLWKNFNQIPDRKKIVVKKKEGSGSEDLLIGNKINLPKINFDKSYIFQEFIEGQEYGMDILNDLNGNFVHCCVKKKNIHEVR